MQTQTRAEQDTDIAAINSLNRQAFPTSAEADLVDKLRQQLAHQISLVAETEAGIVGHILFTPLTLDTDPLAKFIGLAPMAVAPTCQCQGIGGQLIASGLARCQDLGMQAVFVLGHPRYYPRFGFRPAIELGLRCEFPAPADAFMVRELIPGELDDRKGTVHYHSLFTSL